MKKIFANLKMNLDYYEIDNYIKKLSNIKCKSKFVVCPSYIYLEKFINNSFVVGSQDVSNFEKGSFTGDVSALQLKSLGVKYGIVGHSERRYKFNEDLNVVKEKFSLLVKNGITPILCVGEKYEERDRFKEVIKNQLESCLVNFNGKELVIAYEPIWAIGTGVSATINEIDSAISEIKKYVSANYNVDFSILYGGSVNSKNLKEIINIKNVDGVLVGGASLSYKEVINMIDIL